MPRKPAIKKAPSYFASLHETQEQALERVEHRRFYNDRKNPEDTYTYRVDYNEKFDLWHVREWCDRDGEGYNTNPPKNIT